jgi:Fe-S cluster assembly protein SufB
LYSSPQYDTNQLHAAVVELVALENANIKYSTAQIGIPAMNLEMVVFTILYNEVRAGKNLKFWTQVETGS